MPPSTQRVVAMIAPRDSATAGPQRNEKKNDQVDGEGRRDQDDLVLDHLLDDGDVQIRQPGEPDRYAFRRRMIGESTPIASTARRSLR